ncbi:MAG: type II toxin-antitoxin system RelE/ParE family toxin [Dehalococcoidia bacterium]
MAWEIEYTDEFEVWWASLTPAEGRSIRAAVEKLEGSGPALGRPFVDTIKGSRHANMKELRPRRGNIRILFAFNPLRTAILLIGGDKTNRWDEWYATVIPIADDLYDIHLRELHEEGAL